MNEQENRPLVEGVPVMIYPAFEDTSFVYRMHKAIHDDALHCGITNKPKIWFKNKECLCRGMAVIHSSIGTACRIEVPDGTIAPEDTGCSIMGCSVGLSPIVDDNFAWLTWENYGPHGCRISRVAIS